MKNLLMTIGTLLFCSCLVAQKDFEKLDIRILPQSELIIAGSTNVNKFDCRFDVSLISDKRPVQFSSEKDEINFPNLSLKLLTNGFDCGNRRMNQDFRDLLKSDKYPEIIIKLEKVQLISDEYVKAFIRVKLAGKENVYNLPVQMKEDRFIGKFRMNIRDFGLKPPVKALGLIEVNEEIEVQFSLLVER